MKKILFTFLIGIPFIGCSNSDDNSIQQNPTTTSQYFHPPNWIQGTWKIGNTSYYKFTNDDFIYVMNGTSYKTILTQTAASGQTAKVDETISNTDYNFAITTGSSSGEYKFHKINTTRIQWINNTTSPQPVYLDKE